MKQVDLSKPWVILSSARPDRPAELTAARELSRRLGALGGRDVPVLDAAAPAPDGTAPLIALNAGDGGNGYSWRAGEDRIELYGDSPKGLLNAAFDFLDALEAGDGASAATPIALRRSSAHVKAGAVRRVDFPEPDGRPAEELIEAAARAKADVARFGPGFRRPEKTLHEGVRRAAKDYGVAIEVEGPSPASLLPVILLPFRSDLFRMEDGRRKAGGGFCPTNPEAAALAARRAARFFRNFPHADYYRFPTVPEDASRAWCSCPACRAFTPAEQTLMTANAVADALAETAPRARLVLALDREEGTGSAVSPKPNLDLLSS